MFWWGIAQFVRAVVSKTTCEGSSPSAPATWKLVIEHKCSMIQFSLTCCWNWSQTGCTVCVLPFDRRVCFPALLICVLFNRNSFYGAAVLLQGCRSSPCPYRVSRTGRLSGIPDRVEWGGLHKGGGVGSERTKQNRDCFTVFTLRRVWKRSKPLRWRLTNF